MVKIKRSGDNIFVRCSWCGDSENPNHSHLSVHIRKGIYHCYRCGVSGKFPKSVHSQILLEQGLSGYSEDRGREDELPALVIEPGPGSSRPSALPRFHAVLEDGRIWDAFEFFQAATYSHTGWYLRDPSTKNHYTLKDNYGGLLFKPPYPVNGAVIVEGAYDVIADNFVAYSSLPLVDKVAREVPPFSSFWIRPDGDCWGTKNELGVQIMRSVARYYNYRFAHLSEFLGIDFILDNKDPDEVGIDEVIRVDAETIRSVAYEISKNPSDRWSSWYREILDNR